MEVKIYFDCLLEFLLGQKVADVHFVAEQAAAKILIRAADKKMQMIAELMDDQMRKLQSYIKYISGMSLAKAVMESGVLHYQLNGRMIDLRIAVMPMHAADLMTMRIHYQDNRYDFDYLTSDVGQQQFLRELCYLDQGMIVFSGATGNGKTTTIYTLMYHMLALGKHVVTIEDPIEQKIDGALQFEVNDAAGRSYDTILAQSLRHDPDVIVIGEIRNSNVAQSALRAALTGHLVITTIHAQSSSKVIQRLLDLGCQRELLAVTLAASLYQQLRVNPQTMIKYCEFSYLMAAQIQQQLATSGKGKEALDG